MEKNSKLMNEKSVLDYNFLKYNREKNIIKYDSCLKKPNTQRSFSSSTTRDSSNIKFINNVVHNFSFNNSYSSNEKNNSESKKKNVKKKRNNFDNFYLRMKEKEIIKQRKLDELINLQNTIIKNSMKNNFKMNDSSREILNNSKRLKDYSFPLYLNYNNKINDKQFLSLKYIINEENNDFHKNNKFSKVNFLNFLKSNEMFLKKKKENLQNKYSDSYSNLNSSYTFRPKINKKNKLMLGQNSEKDVTLKMKNSIKKEFIRLNSIENNKVKTNTFRKFNNNKIIKTMNDELLTRKPNKTVKKHNSLISNCQLYKINVSESVPNVIAKNIIRIKQKDILNPNNSASILFDYFM